MSSEEIWFPEKVIEVVRGAAMPKPEDDQNTDAIIPADPWLKVTTFEGLREKAYYNERRDDDGNLKPEHPFNNPAYEGATILIGGANYGKGSSREHAPQALMRTGAGIRGIIAVSFEEIFADNCKNIGLVGVTVPRSDVDNLAEIVQREPATVFEIDLRQGVVRYDAGGGNYEIPFGINEGRRNAFLTGTWDSLPVLLANDEKIRKVEARLPYLRMPEPGSGLP
jgi:3-isopropylmalate/(R)-2-methylmalate dehydratase small subunit